MNLNLAELKTAAQAADQGVWSIGQSTIETNGGMIECTNRVGDDHEANMRFIGIAGNPRTVLELVERLERGEAAPEDGRQLSDENAAHTDTPSLEVLKDQANGWKKVFDTLTEVYPSWHKHYYVSTSDLACLAIRELSEKAALADHYQSAILNLVKRLTKSEKELALNVDLVDQARTRIFELCSKYEPESLG